MGGKELEVKIINKSKNPEPEYGSEHAAGMDIRANLNERLVIKPGEIRLVHTGIYIELPVGYEAQIRPRSGLALKHGLTVLNTPGTIDADYRGEVGIIIINHGKEDFIVNNGDRICQMVVARHEKVIWQKVNNLNNTDRGNGGFGHTGKK